MIEYWLLTSGESGILEARGTFFSRGGVIIGKKHFVMPIEGSINSFCVRFC
jgi:hypothetical protein